jgi:hypothetical protein
MSSRGGPASRRERGAAARAIFEIGRPFNALGVCGRVALEERTQMDVLVPVGDADRQVAQGIRTDVDAVREQALVL